MHIAFDLHRPRHFFVVFLVVFLQLLLYIMIASALWVSSTATHSVTLWGTEILRWDFEVLSFLIASLITFSSLMFIHIQSLLPSLSRTAWAKFCTVLLCIEVILAVIFVVLGPSECSGLISTQYFCFRGMGPIEEGVEVITAWKQSIHSWG